MEDLIHGARELAPEAVAVSCPQRYLLRVRFSTGELRDFDMSPLLARKCYSALRSESLFQTARVECGVVQWANGADLDPDWLYEDSVPAAE